ncbi:MAG TPA: hypothetical protein VGR28_10735, partial [Candidatus Thermoplasmatota archaeon]|nr:hypothetical protein [Candidatus Thermoplasmatota archaeon]
MRSRRRGPADAVLALRWAVAGLVLAALALAAAAAAGPTWTDEARSAGVAFRMAGEVHNEADFDWPAFPEIMGGGACWADVDDDGYDDLYL